MSFGITAEGFVPKTLAEIKADIEAALRGELGETIDVSSEGPLGQIIGVMADRYAELWMLAQTAYTAGTPDGATDAALDALAALTGTVRELASPSTVVLTMTGTPTTLLTAGRVASVDTVGTRFATIEAGTIAAADPWLDDTDVNVGDIVTVADKIYVCITAGHTASSPDGGGTGEDITDGTAHWRYVGEGTGYVQLEAEAEQTGPLQGLSGTITTIETPVSGWESVKNLLDADLGADLETDASLRLRREDELRQAGKGTLASIREALLDLDGVISATVFQNITDSTDGDGIPPHSVEALVRGGTDDEIFQTLFANVAAGIRTHGSEVDTVTDSEGFDHTVKFTRPDEVPIYVIINAKIDEDLYPADGGAQIKAAIVAFGDAQKGGKDVVSSSVGARAFAIDGVLDVEALIGLAPTPTLTATLPIGLRELAVFDTSRIIVNTTPVTP